MAQITSYLWVVEMLIKNKWESTHGVSFTKEDGGKILKEYKSDNPDDEFRLTKYIPIDC